MAKTVQELVQAQVAAKIAAGEALEQAVAQVKAKADELATVQKEAATARRSALSTGWTEAELKSLGLAERSRPRRRSNTSPVAAETSSDDPGQ